jgi:hypothetical protein
MASYSEPPSAGSRRGGEGWRKRMRKEGEKRKIRDRKDARKHDRRKDKDYDWEYSVSLSAGRPPQNLTHVRKPLAGNIF